MKLTSVLSLGTKEDVEKHTLETLSLGGKSGFIIAPGCDLVMDTPIENLQTVSMIVSGTSRESNVKTDSDDLATKSAAETTKRQGPNKVNIDIITLDSSSCPPCQYMVEAMKQAAKAFGDRVACNEYSIKTKPGLHMMETLGVKNVPVTVIDGEISFVSQIPPKEVIEKAIKKKLAAKGLIK